MASKEPKANQGIESIMTTALNINRVSVHLLKQGIWPWPKGIEARLPLHYKLRFVELYTKKPEPVHIKFQPEHYRDEETGVVKRRQLADIPAIYCREQDEGLWGGVGLIKGFVDPKRKMCRRVPRIWRPRLVRRIYYSEILDRYMELVVTHRTMDLVDEAQGLDNYILQTHQVDLKSRLGMRLKQDMLRSLRTRSAGKPETRDEVYNKYREFDVLEDEEIEWLGLSLKEAVRKQKELELQQAQEAVKPLKHIYTRDLIADIQAAEESGGQFGKETKKSGLMSRIFGEKS